MDLMNRLRLNNKGSYTVEACIVVPTVLLVLFAVIFSFIFMCQKAMLTAVAGHCAQKGAALWIEDSFNAHGETGQDDGYRTALYYRVTALEERDSTTIDVSRELESRLEAIAADLAVSRGAARKLDWVRYAAYSRIGRCLMRPEKTNVGIVYRNDFIKSRVQVTITQEIKIPFGFIKKWMDGKETLTLKAVGTAAVAEPAEYIRNVDLALEYGKRLAGKLNSVLDGIKSEAAKE